MGMALDYAHQSCRSKSTHNPRQSTSFCWPDQSAVGWPVSRMTGALYLLKSVRHPVPTVLRVDDSFESGCVGLTLEQKGASHAARLP